MPVRVVCCALALRCALTCWVPRHAPCVLRSTQLSHPNIVRILTAAVHPHVSFCIGVCVCACTRRDRRLQLCAPPLAASPAKQQQARRRAGRSSWRRHRWLAIQPCSPLQKQEMDNGKLHQEIWLVEEVRGAWRVHAIARVGVCRRRTGLQGLK